MPARPFRPSMFALLALAVVAAWSATACGSSSISTVAPTGSKCQVTASSSADAVPYAGGTGTVTVTTNRDCTWSAKTAASWIAITSAADGQGDGTISVRVSPNADPSPRHGTVSVNDASVELTQQAAPCQFTVAPTQAAVSANGGSVRVSVSSSSPACAWTATSNSGWIDVAAPAGGTGSATVTLNVASNGGDAREGSASVAGQTVFLRQDAATAPPPPPPPDCTYALTPPSQTVAASGGAASVGVATNIATCAWDARSDAPWITFTTGTGTGSGTAAFNVATNSGAARTATLTIGTATATVSQPAAACAFAIAPDSAPFGANGGTGSVTVTVTSGANCAWSATENVSWISITSGQAGNGNGTVTFAVSANTGPARSATMTVAGKPFIVSQDAAPCSYSISPSSQGLAAAGGTGSFTVTAQNGCAWSASANGNWISITGGATGSGTGTVSFSVAANSGASRTGTITAGGQTFTVTQDAFTCSYTIAPTTQAVPAAGGNGSVTITTGASCTWSATASAPWITFSSSAAGTGSGSVAFVVAANPDMTPRSGTINVGGQTLTISQDAAPCTYTIAPANAIASPNGDGGAVSVTTGAICSWTATSNNNDWLGVVGGASGTGSGTVSWNAAPNGTGAPRTGTLTIGGQTFTVNQGAGGQHHDLGVNP